MNYDRLTAALNDPACDAIVRANRIVLPGGSRLEAVAVARHHGHLRVVSRSGGNGPAGGSSSRFVILDADGGILHRTLWGFAEVAGMLAADGWRTATVEPAANDQPAVAKRLLQALQQLPDMRGRAP